MSIKLLWLLISNLCNPCPRIPRAHRCFLLPRSHRHYPSCWICLNNHNTRPLLSSTLRNARTSSRRCCNRTAYLPWFPVRRKSGTSGVHTRTIPANQTVLETWAWAVGTRWGLPAHRKKKIKNSSLAVVRYT